MPPALQAADRRCRIAILEGAKPALVNNAPRDQFC